ncbi:hypothetical protein BT69DRAFT_1201663, partial [Atractiella rhizophila]
QCVNTCLGFTGEYQDPATNSCPHCARLLHRQLPRRQFAYLSFLPRLRELFDNPETAKSIGDFGKLLHESIKVVDKMEKQYRDWYDGQILHSLHKSSQNVLRDPRETAFYASTDGASLQLRRADSNAWIFILTASCYPPKSRYLKEHIFLLCIVPGPNNPINISSFFY